MEFLDLKKAFDCVDHNILTEKLVKFGCIGNTLNWFKSYLMNRKQMCKVNQTTSKCRKISSGVPQGSNLGPILFLLFVNDLPNCLKSTSASMFADNTNLTASGNTITELHNKLNNDCGCGLRMRTANCGCGLRMRIPYSNKKDLL